MGGGSSGGDSGAKTSVAAAPSGESGGFRAGPVNSPSSSPAAATTSSTIIVTVAAPTADVAPVQEIIVVGEGGTTVDLTKGVGEFINRGLAFSTSDVASGTNTNAATAAFDNAGNLIGFDEPSDTQTVRYSIGSASNLDTGFDANSQLRWGRWAEGVAQTGADGSTFSDFELSNSSLHWVVALTDEELPTQSDYGQGELYVSG